MVRSDRIRRRVMVWLGVWAKQIGLFLGADTCLRTVAGKDRCFFGQGVEFLADGVEELIVIPSGEIRAANTAVEEGISGEEGGVGDQVEGD